MTDINNVSPTTITAEEIQHCILFVRGQKVILDTHLAMLYEV
ncbi:MAG: hypothetical protein ACHQJ6_01760 [Candidatus Berkiellales bacterium]